MSIRKCVNILSIIVILFSVIASPVSAIAMENDDVTAINLQVEQGQASNQLTWIINETEVGEEFSHFFIWKNGEASIVEPTKEQLDSDFVQYSYLDTEVEPNTTYTYQSAGVTVSNLQIESNKVTITTSDFEVSEGEVEPPVESEPTETPDLDGPLVDNIRLVVGGVAMATPKQEDYFLLDMGDLMDPINEGSPLEDNNANVEGFSIESSIDALEGSASYNGQSFYFGFTNGNAFIPLMSLFDLEEDATLAQFKQALANNGDGKIKIQLLGEDGNVSTYYYEFMRTSLYEGDTTDGSVEPTEPTEPEQPAEPAVEGPIVENIMWTIEGSGFGGAYNQEKYFEFDFINFLDPAWTIDSPLENDESIVSGLTIEAFNDIAKATVTFNGQDTIITFNNGLASISINDLFHLEGEVTLGEFKEALANNGDGKISISLLDNDNNESIYYYEFINTSIFKVISFEDPILEENVRDHLAVYDRELTGKDLQDLTTLHATDQGIENLSGLEYATNLVGLDLSGNNIEDLSPLTNLTNLESVVLWENRFTDVSPLSSLPNLSYLSIDYNPQLEDISPLSNLTNLSTLILSYTGVQDITSLHALTNLNELYLYELDLDLSEGSNTQETIYSLESQGVSVYYYEESPDDNNYEFLHLVDVTSTSSSITIQWDASDSFEDFEVLLNGELVDTLAGDTREYVFANLDSYTSYDIEVTPTLDTDNLYGRLITTKTSWIEEELVDVQIQLVDPTQEPIEYGYLFQIKGLDETNSTFVEFGSVYAGSLEMWGQHMGLQLPIGSYKIKFYDEESLSRYAEFEIEIQEDNNYEENPINLILDEEALSSFQPFEMNVTNVTENSFDLTWENSEITSASNLYVYVDNGENFEVVEEVILESDQTSYSFASLDKDTLYRVGFETKHIFGRADVKNLNVRTNGGEVLGEVVEIADSNLEQAIREELGIYLRDLTNGDLEQLTTLNAPERQINDLSGIENAVNLVNLNLFKNNITDISLLSELTALDELVLWDNQIEDVSSLSNLTNLRYLDLEFNQIVDISPLIDLTNLETLYLVDNPISDYSTAEALVEAGVNVHYDGYEEQDLSIAIAEISDSSISIDWYVSDYVEVVEEYELILDGESVFVDSETTSYTFSELEPNTRYAIEVLAHLPNDNTAGDWTEVWTEGVGTANEVQVQILDMPTSDQGYHEFLLEGISQTNVSVSKNGYVNEEGFLTNFEDNTVFDLPVGEYQLFIYTPMGDLLDPTYTIEVLDGVDHINQPIEVSFTGNSDEITGEVVTFNDENLKRAIGDALGIYDRELYTSDLENLTSLPASGYSIEDLTGLEHAINLSNIDFYDNAISDISLLESLTSLTSLILWENNISDISPLANLENLTYLDLDTNNITDVSPLAGLSNLETLWLANNPSEDVSSLATLTNLTDLFLNGLPLDFENTQSLEAIETLQSAGVNVTYDNQVIAPSLDVYVESVTDTTAQIEWWLNNATTVDHFDLYINGEKVETVSSDEQSYTYELLNPNTEYIVHVDAVNDDGVVIATAGDQVLTAHAQEDVKQVKLQAKDKDNQVIDRGLEYSIEGLGENNQDVYLYGQTDEDGFFRSWYDSAETVTLPVGDYEVIVYGEDSYLNTIQTVSILSDQEAYTITVDQLEAETKDVTIKVVDENDEPVTEINDLSFYSYDVMNAFNYEFGDYYLWNESNEAGEYLLEDVVVTDQYKYQLNLRAPGYITYNQTNVEVQENSDVITITMSPGASITGNVVNNSGSPLVGVSYYVSGNNIYEYGQTSEQDLTIDGLVAEDLMVELSMEGYQSKTIEVSAEEFVDNEFNLGTVELLSEKYVHGKVLKEDGSPAKNVNVYLFVENEEWSSLWARTDAEGYFKIRNVEDGTYRIETEAYNLPNVEVTDVTPIADPYTIILEQEGEGSFVGEGNGFTAAKQTVVPGQTLDYRLNFKNNGDSSAENVEVSFNLPTNVELNEESVLLNGQVVQLDRGNIIIPNVEVGQAGTITFKVNVSEEVTQSTIISTANLSLGEDNLKSYTATTNVLSVSLTAPAITAQSDINVYGTAKPGATVKIYDGDLLLAETTANSKWWYADVSLPTTIGENSTHQLVAKVSQGENVSYSKPVTIDYQPDIVEFNDVNISAGWNQNITINPNTGIVTTAIVEFTPIDITVGFTGEVDSAAIHFLGEEYELTKEGENYGGIIPGDWSSYGEQLLELSYTVNGEVIRVPLMEVIVLIDPSGYVFEGSMDNRLQGATAVVEQQVGTRWQQWNAEFFNQINPQVTDEDGRYGWDVIEGNWRVIFSKADYETYTSRTVVVPPAETQLNVPLVRIAKPIVNSITPVDGGTDAALDGSVTIEFDRLMNEATIDDLIKVYNSNDQLVEGQFVLEGINGYKQTPGKPGYYEEDQTKKLSQTIVWNPASDLNPNETYKVVIDQSIQDYSGKSLEASVESVFTTLSAETDEETQDETETPTGEEGSEDIETPAGEEGSEDTETPVGEEGSEETETPVGEEGNEETETPVGEEGSEDTETPVGEEVTEDTETPVGEEDNEQTEDQDTNKEVSKEDSSKSGDLPDTATNTFNLLFISMLFLVTGILLYALSRRRQL
ncbi:DUF11 domain-containing protein [Aquibacillus halophilus]|uniref:DUF11 domain-containing protein n=1 Tax=Aquibacillus halophilus TaxID=930132 RepID=A0A6A8D7E5_9BACI|nr:leucine-rich repeat domain-containing protein [Aquibacillus halophilus]MRH41200.1 DUF11 domain-containing protein [Aquibacillus halophilus]